MTKQPHERVNQSKHDIIVNNFLGGIAWGLGVTIGLSIVLAVLGLLANAIGVVPFVGNFVSEVIKYLNQNNPHLR
jgi:hypothetical protein